MSQQFGDLTVIEFQEESVTKAWKSIDLAHLDNVFNDSSAKAKVVEALPEQWKTVKWNRNDEVDFEVSEDPEGYSFIKGIATYTLNVPRDEWSEVYTSEVPVIRVIVKQKNIAEAELSAKLTEKGVLAGTEATEVPVYDITDFNNVLAAALDVDMETFQNPNTGELLKNEMKQFHQDMLDDAESARPPEYCDVGGVLTVTIKPVIGSEQASKVHYQLTLEEASHAYNADLNDLDKGLYFATLQGPVYLGTFVDTQNMLDSRTEFLPGGDGEIIVDVGSELAIDDNLLTNK